MVLIFYVFVFVLKFYNLITLKIYTYRNLIIIYKNIFKSAMRFYMKRSRLKLFKTTSLTISLLGVILILLTVGVIAYIAVSGFTNSVSSTVSSGSSYDQLDQLKSEYHNVSVKYGELNQKLGTSPDSAVKTQYNNGKIKLSEVNGSLASIQNDINNGKTEGEIQNKMNQTRSDLKEVEDIYNQLIGSK